MELGLVVIHTLLILMQLERPLSTFLLPDKINKQIRSEELFRSCSY